MREVLAKLGTRVLTWSQDGWSLPREIVIDTAHDC